MKIYAIYFYRKESGKMALLDSATDFSDIGFVHRKNAQEICQFGSFQLADGNNTNRYVSAQEGPYILNLYRPSADVGIVIVTDQEYPSRSSFAILRQISTEYQDNGLSFPGGQSATIRKGITEYQQPERADKILQIQKNIEEIQQVMVTNLEMAIARGETLEEMAERSDQLSAASKAFVRQSKKLNGCCH